MIKINKKIIKSFIIIKIVFVLILIFYKYFHSNEQASNTNKVITEEILFGDNTLGKSKLRLRPNEKFVYYQVMDSSLFQILFI